MDNVRAVEICACEIAACIPPIGNGTGYEQLLVEIQSLCRSLQSNLQDIAQCKRDYGEDVTEVWRTHVDLTISRAETLLAALKFDEWTESV